MLLVVALLASGDTDDTDPIGACEPLAPGDLDLRDVCAEGLCASVTYDEAVAAWGDPGPCEDAERVLICRWSSGVAIVFDDFDEDGVIDSPDDHDVFSQAWIFEAPYAGATVEGLGLGVAAACFDSTFGPPRELDPSQWWLTGSSNEPTTLTIEGDPVTRITAEWSWSE
jgi:hypothetical protein